MKITEQELELLQEAAAEYDFPDYDPEKHIALGIAAEYWGITKNSARSRMNKLVKQGKYIKLIVRRDDNRLVTAYEKLT